MKIALVILSAALGLVSFFLAVVVPIGALFDNRRLVLRNEDRHVSTTPVMGILVGFVAVLFAPIATLGDRLSWSWVPLAVEGAVYGAGLAYWNLNDLGRVAERQRRTRSRE